MAIEEPANSALLMDRGLPVGNSEGVDLRRALHVKVRNKPSEAIPVSVSSITLTPGFSTLVPGQPSQVSVTTASTSVLAANPARLFAWVSNNTAQTIYVQFGAAASLGMGLRLCSGAKLFLSGSDLWLGEVFGITATGSVDVDVTEMTL